MGKLERTDSHPSSPKPEAPRGSRPSEPNLAQTISLQWLWASFLLTLSGKPNNAQAKSHLAQAQLG